MKFYAFWLSLLCVIIFIIQLSFPSSTSALLLNENSFIQPYRFVTSIFLHGGTTHLVFNLFALLFFGLVLEKLIGDKKFLLVFFVSGIFANLIAVNFYTASLGASGSIFGIIGALTIIKPMMGVWAFSLPMPMFVASILWVGANIIQTFVPSNVGTIAHLSGIGVGIIFGFYIRFKKKKPKSLRYDIKLPELYMQNWENRNIRP